MSSNLRQPISASRTLAGRVAEAIPIEHELHERLVRVGVIGLPLAALGAAGWLAWGGSLHWQDLLVLAIAYVLMGAGITVGYHRLFTHRSFATSRPLRVVFAVLGSMAVEGSVIEWVATHRKHHSFSDRPGDPHSPHAEQAPGWRGALRIFLLHHATFSINSLCQFFGRSPFGTGDESRNVAWLVPITFGEAWHNNHHAFPTSARHGLGPRQADPGAWMITALERCHLVWSVVRITPERQRAKRLSTS